MIDFFNWLTVQVEQLTENTAQEVAVIFPENKPELQERQKELFIVENQNESDEVPENTNLLSEKNSRAKNPEVADLLSPSLE